jgi:integrase
MRLTKTALAKLTPSGLTTIAWDDLTRGFGYRLYPSGVAAFVVRYRLKGSRRQRIVVIGSPAVVSIDQARAIAAKHLAAAREGVDLAADTVERVRVAEQAAKARAARMTVSAAVSSYIEGFSVGEGTNGRRRSPASLKAEKAWLTHIDRAHGADALEDVSSADIREIIGSLAIGSRRCVYGAIARLLRWAVGEGIISADVSAQITPPPRPKDRERTPSPAEVRTFIDTVDRLACDGRLHQANADFLKLVALTGQRRREVALLQWQDIDWPAAEWKQDGARNKTKRAHVVPLGAHAMTILERRKAETLARGDELSGLTLPAPHGGKSIDGNADNLMSVLQGEGISFRLHDLRRAMVSAMAERGVDFAVADALLNHAQSASRGGTLGVYQRAELKAPKRRAIEIWERALFEETAGEEVVVPLRRIKK